MNDAAPIATPLVRQMVQPSAITIIAEEFGFRRNGIDKAHVRTLAQALRNGGGKLDPILLWREIGPSGDMGRLILLAGAHRLAAYRQARKGTQGANKAVPAIVATCSRAEAMALALFANSKDTLPLTQREKTDGAWRLVRFHNDTHSKTKIASISGISPRTVTRMRGRWKAMLEAGLEATGQWWRDRLEDPLEDTAQDGLTEAERMAEVIKLGNALREAAGSWPKLDSTLVAEALQVAFGFHLRGMAEFLYGASEDDEDEFFNTPISTRTDAQADTDGNEF